MILYLYNKHHGLCAVDAAEHNEEGFRLEHTDAAGAKRPLVDIDREGDNWVAYATSWARLHHEGRAVDGVPLTHALLLVISDASSGESYFLLCAEPGQAAGGVRVFELPPNDTLTIGYGQCDINYPCQLISSSHALIRIDNGRIVLQDDNSTNGTYLNRSAVREREIVPGDVMDLFGLRVAFLGSCIAVRSLLTPYTVSTRLQPFSHRVVQESAAGRQKAHAGEDQELIFERSPRIAFKREAAKLQVENPPNKPNNEEMPLVFTVGSSALMSMSSMMMAVSSLQNVTLAGGGIMRALPSLFMAGSMFIGGLVMPIVTRKYTDKRNEKKEEERQAKYLAYLASFEERIARIGREQKEYLLSTYPDNTSLARMVQEQSPLVWGRIPKHRDFLDLRLGTAELPVDVHIDYPRQGFTLDEDVMRSAVQEFQDKKRTVPDAPFILSLKETGILGVYASYEVRMRYVQGLLLQLCAQHSYTEMKLVLIYPKSEEADWEWARWLPHLWSDNHELRAIATERDSMRYISSYLDSFATSDKARREDSDVHCVAVIADMRLAEQCQALMRGIHDIRQRPLSVIALADRVSQLPKECKSVVTLNEQEGYLYPNIDDMESPVPFRQDAVPVMQLREFAAQLGRMHLTGAAGETALPDSLSFYAMMRWGNVGQCDLSSRWRKSDPIKTLAAPVGVDADGALMSLDIHQNAHGPHGLVAGMTGSGKSEFVITYLLSMAVTYSPLEVGFVLIDYKGGGMSDTLKALPHVVGIIDNLGGSVGIHRSMNSLSAELKRRQRVFKEVGDRLKQSNLDIYRYQKLFREGAVSEPMQHIIIVSDEFAELKQQEPDFMDELVSAARIGRSLGVHLILATQKPAGIVDGQIESNTRFRVCLKVQDEADSRSMLKRTEAATLTRTGRYYLQVGNNEMFLLGQSGWSGAPSIPMERYTELPDDSIELVNELGMTTMKARLPKKDDGVKRIKQVDELVEHVRQGAEREGMHIQPIWLPMLRTDVTIDEIEKQHKPEHKPYSIAPVIGMVDDPFMQSQYPMQLDLIENGNTIIYGVTGSGCTELLSAAVYDLCRNHPANEINIYCLDFATETLQMFQNMPQVGDVIVPGDEEKLQKLMLYLEEEIDRRRKLLSEYGGSLEAYRKEHPESAMPNILLVVDNYPGFAEGYSAYDDMMYSLIRDGLRVGMHAIISAVSSSSLRLRLTQSFKRVICMQMPERAEYTLLLGTANEALPMNRVGSGVFRGGEHVLEFQTALISGSEAGKVAEEMRRLGRELSAVSRVRAHRVRLMPDTVTAQLLLDGAKSAPLNGVPIGLDRRDLRTIRWNLTERFVNAALYESKPEYPFLESFAGLLAEGGERRVMVLDMSGSLRLPERPNVEAYGVSRLPEALSAITGELLRRNNEEKTARAEGKELPVYQELVILVNGLAEMAEAADAIECHVDVGGRSMKISGKDALDAVMLKGRAGLNMTFVIYQQVDRVSALLSRAWYKNVAIREGLWLGDGVKRQSLMATNGISGSEKLPEGAYGYFLPRGKTVRLKIIAG